jgi:hypothetical protein
MVSEPTLTMVVVTGASDPSLPAQDVKRGRKKRKETSK